MNRKRIAFLLFSMTGAGEERIASLLLQRLHVDYDIHLVLFNGPIDYRIPKSIQITYLRKFSRFFLFRALSLPILFFKYLHFCKKHEIDISLSFDNVPNYINCLLKIFDWKGKAYIREVNYPSSRYRNGIKSIVHRFFIKRYYPKADIIFVNALRIGVDLVTKFKTPERLIHLFINPVDFDMILKLSKSDIPKPTRFTFIHVGAFRHQKNHHLLIEAFASIKHLDAQLWLIGKGPLELKIKEEIEKRGLTKIVKILGFQINPYQYMKKADCMVMTSDFEGLPNVLIEGMACGLPIVSTDCLSGPREMIAPNFDKKKQVIHQIEVEKYGILSPVGDSKAFAKGLEKILSDKVLHKQLVSNVKNRIHEFDIDNVISNQLKKHLR